ncbi:MAG: translocation/assembly module TamB domain-containing protein [Capnocytophaga sp.]|nr:translocation/assembly module TamB domain-containing protein [Capnocytophaga sp.]
MLSLPVTQTVIAKQVVAYLNKSYGIGINIERIHLQVNGKVNVKKILINDDANDTLISAKSLKTSILNFGQLVNGNLYFGGIEGDSLVLNMRTHKGDTLSNLDAFIGKFDSGKPPSDIPFIMKAKSIKLRDSFFRVIDDNNEVPLTFEAAHINTLVEAFEIHGSDISLEVKNGHFLMDKKLQLTQMETQFRYTDSLLSAGNSHIKTEKSELQGDIKFYPKNGSMADFLNNVSFDISLSKATLATEDLNTFYDGFANEKTLNVTDLIMKGPLNDFSVTQGIINYQNTLIDGRFHFKNLFKENQNIEVQGDVVNFTSIYNDLAYLMPSVLGENIPDIIQQLGIFNAHGTFHYSTVSLETDMELAFGNASAHVAGFMDNLENLDHTQYRGMVSTHNFPLGKLLDESSLGGITADITVNGQGFTLKSMRTYASGDIHAVHYNDYSYKNINFAGDFENQVFNGDIKTNDPNAKFTFSGLADFSKENSKFDFEADIENLDFYALHFLELDSISRLKGKILIDIEGNSLDDIAGNISFKNTQYTNTQDTFFFKDFEVTAQNFDGGLRKISINSPDIINGNVNGVFKMAETKKIFQNAFGSIYANYNPYKISENQYINFDFQINSKIVEIFVPKLQLADNTTLKGSIVADDGSFKMQFKSPEINAFDYEIDKVNLAIDNKNPLYNTFFEIDKADLGMYAISDFNLINTTIKDTLFFRTEFKGGEQKEDSYELNFYHTLNERQESIIGLKKSSFNFKGNQWFINRDNEDTNNKIVISRTADTISVDNFRLSHQKQYLSLNGVFSGSNYKNLHVVANNVSLDKITPSIAGLDLKGTINGHLSLLQRDNLYYPSSDVFIRYFRLNGYDYGDLEMSVYGNNDLSAFKVNAHFINGKAPGFRLAGDVNLDKKQGMLLDLNAHFGRFNLSPFNPFLEGVMYDLRGWVSGDIKIEGSLDNPQMDGKLSIAEGGLGIDYLKVNVDLQPDAEIIVSNQTFEIKNWTLTDTAYKTQASLNGNIRHNKLADWFLDLSLNTNNKRFLVLNTPYADDALFYGTGFINGDATIKGAIDELVIAVDAVTADGTKFKIPLSDTESIGDDSFITFIEKNEKHVQIERTLQSVKGLELNFELNILPVAEVEIIIDQKTGSNLVGRGEGTLLIEINTNGKFNMWGDFITYSGYYNFKYENIIDKRFTVLPGGSISWGGDPLKATLRNLQAAYTLNANPSVLLESSQYNRKIPTQVVIKLEGELMKPETLFDINFPDSNPGLVSELNYRLEDQDRKQLQAFSLLAQGSFMSERNADSRIVAYNLFETAAGLFNSILSDEDNKLNLGVSYEAGITDTTSDLENSDRLGFTVSTQVNDWVNINAKVGIPVGGVSRTAVAGDVEVQLKLTEDGSLTAKIFNRENEWQQYLADRIGYTQGFGVAYTVDFNTFKELIHKIFGKKGTVIEPAKTN